jgi:hypothetical protein
MVNKANDILDDMFAQGEMATAMLRAAELEDDADKFEREYIRLHDEALAAHAAMLEASLADKVREFRANFRVFVSTVEQLQQAVGSVATTIKK